MVKSVISGEYVPMYVCHTQYITCGLLIMSCHTFYLPILMYVDQTEITKKHPKVVKAVEEAVKVAVGAFAATEEMYVDAIKGGIAIAEERKAKQTGVKPA